MRSIVGAVVVPAALAGGAVLVLAGQVAVPPAVLVSVSSKGIQGDDISTDAAVTPDGLYVAFRFDGTNLVKGDRNGLTDIVVRDRVTGKTERASVKGKRKSANQACYNACISADGNFVLFTSQADNLVKGDTNGVVDVFLRDRGARRTIRVSLNADGEELTGGGDEAGLALSADGRFVVFFSSSENLLPGGVNGQSQVVLKDLSDGSITLVSANGSGQPGNGASYDPSIAPGGGFVALESTATDLAAGNTDGVLQAYVWNRLTGEIRRASVDGAGTSADDHALSPVVSDDGNRVAFVSAATNLVAGDTNGAQDAFLHDFGTGTTTRLSVPVGGGQASEPSYGPSMTADGSQVAFYTASALVPEDLNGGAFDVYVWSASSGQVRLVSANGQGQAANGYSFLAPTAFASNGQWIAIYSGATDFGPLDENETSDVFLLDLRPPE